MLCINKTKIIPLEFSVLLHLVNTYAVHA
jgi:hypothetical protein